MSDDTYQIEMLWDCPAGHKRNRGKHKACETCGRPKTVDEEFYMPDDTSRAAAVTDKNELRYALGGEDWHCRYCSSSQRRPDGTCKECGSDQSDTVKSEPVVLVRTTAAPSKELAEKYRPRIAKLQKQAARQAERLAPRSTPPRETVSAYIPDDEPPYKSSPMKWLIAIPGVAILLALIIWAVTPSEHDVTVADVYFQHAVHVEKYQILHDEGWDYPVRAFDVEREGKRVHHHDRVEDGWTTEYYTERVADGQSCTTRTTPRSCTSNKNGYATCSGGNTVRDCHTKYRNERRSRRVTKYKDVPVYREWYSWKVWDWKHDRDVFATGHTLDVRWPSEEEIGLCRTCKEGEQERIKHDDRYTIKFSDGEDTWNYTPDSLAEYKTFNPGSRRRIKVTLGNVELIPLR